MKAILAIPLVVFIGIVLVFLTKLVDEPQIKTSPLVGAQIENFTLPALYDGAEDLSPENLRGEYYLLNVFASWCLTCVAEHADLLKISKKIKIYGINWKDKKTDAKSWLKKHGNPYKNIGWDYKSEAVLRLGVSGAPESFLISPDGVIIYHYAGQVTVGLFDKKIMPLLK